MAGEVSISLEESFSRDLCCTMMLGIIYFTIPTTCQKEHNCDLIDLEDTLQNGTVISETLIEKPHSFYTA